LTPRLAALGVDEPPSAAEVAEYAAYLGMDPQQVRTMILLLFKHDGCCTLRQLHLHRRADLTLVTAGVSFVSIP
jgi:hypothetical protein